MAPSSWQLQSICTVRPVVPKPLRCMVPQTHTAGNIEDQFNSRRSAMGLARDASKHDALPVGTQEKVQPSYECSYVSSGSPPGDFMSILPSCQTMTLHHPELSFNEDIYQRNISISELIYAYTRDRVVLLQGKNRKVTNDINFTDIQNKLAIISVVFVIHMLRWSAVMRS